jgi:hypothetical protein
VRAHGARCDPLCGDYHLRHRQQVAGSSGKGAAGNAVPGIVSEEDDVSVSIEKRKKRASVMQTLFRRKPVSDQEHDRGSGGSGGSGGGGGGGGGRGGGGVRPRAKRDPPANSASAKKGARGKNIRTVAPT